MPHTIAISMRFMTKHYPHAKQEIYTALASSWFDFLLVAFPSSACLALPPHEAQCKNILKNQNIDALILSGGEDVGIFPQRDEAEWQLLQWAEENAIPTLGVCRGMQYINSYYGGSLHDDQSHIATRHGLCFASQYNDIFSQESNSYHGKSIAIQNLAPPLQALAYTTDTKCVEAFKHETKNIYGIMWHPEREAPFKQSDIHLFRQVVGKKHYA